MENLRVTELRIGNLIFQSGQITTIENISRSINDWERVNNKRLFDCTPIPLTEEWLLDFGLEKYEFDHKNNQYRLKDILIVIRDGKFCDYGSSVILETVHQFQNFIFALTGKELTLKP